ncbi:hypothetical protein WSM22_19680 [Cytophagales bacterium WSM2-2]|nr:hypothetical protein WSM22_19680 [Cytophagales bacterium WSM2-2]
MFMKKSIKKIVILCITLAVLSCQKPYDIFDESAPKGVYAYIKGSPTNVLFYFNQPTSSYKTDIVLSGTSKAEKMDTYVVVATQETFVKTTTLPSTTFEVTLQEVATALNKPLSFFTPGAQVVLKNKITSTDGQVWSADNSSHISGGLLSGTAFQNLLADISVFVTCPFVADDAVGTYTVVRDDWEDVYPGDQLHVVKVDASTIDIVQYPVTSNPVPLRIKVDPASGAATIAKQFNGKYTYDLYTAGTGFVFSCVGYITVTMDFTYNGGAYNGYTLIIKK